MTKLAQPFTIGHYIEGKAAGQQAHGFSAWPLANRALYVPLRLPSTERLVSVSIACVTTASGTFDLGVYNDTALLASQGSTSLAVGINTWTLASPLLLVGGQLYYLGMSASSVSSTIGRQVPSAILCREGSVAQEASAHPLPSTATWAAPAAAYRPTFALMFVD